MGKDKFDDLDAAGDGLGDVWLGRLVLSRNSVAFGAPHHKCKTLAYINISLSVSVRVIGCLPWTYCARPSYEAYEVVLQYCVVGHRHADKVICFLILPFPPYLK